MPFITFSRMYGSGGSEVAARVARALGWPLYDNAVVDAVAVKIGIPRAEVSQRDERVPPMAERLAAAMALSAPEMMPPSPRRPTPTPEQQVVEATRRVIEEAVQQGPAVLVGRGAQCLLAERADALHVFCFAPHDFLVRYAIDHWGVAPADAERRVADTNRQREQYVKRHFNRDWLAPQNYHICLNTGWLGIEAAAEIVFGHARRRFG